MKTPLLPASLAFVALSALTGCHHRNPAVYARNSFCADNPETVPLYIGQEPDRPYRVIGVVDGSFAVGRGRQVRKMQIKACRIGADAIIAEGDDGPVVREHTVSTPWGTFTEQKVRHRPSRYGSALAIQFVDGAPQSAPAPAAPPEPPAAPAPPEEQPEQEESSNEAPRGKIQIQAGGIEIHAPSVEFRRAPSAPPAPPPAPAERKAPPPQDDGSWTD